MTQAVTPFPAIALFSSVITYGALLAVVSSSLAGSWSGQASLLSAYSILVAPFVMGIVAYTSRQTRKYSTPHRWAFFAGSFYFVIAPVLLGGIIGWEYLTQR